MHLCWAGVTLSLIPLIYLRHHLQWKALTSSTAPVITQPIKHPALWLLEAAHCHLKAFKRFQASGRVLSYVSMGGLTDQLGVWNALCLVQRHNFQLFGFVPPPPDWHGRISQDITAHVTEYPLRHKQGALRPHLIVIYGQLLWFQSAAGKQRAKTLRTYNYGDQTLRPLSAMMG